MLQLCDRHINRSAVAVKIDSDVWNAKETAECLKAHVETVQRMARRGEIPAFKVGKDWRFHKEALRKWTETQHCNSNGMSP